MDTLVEEAWKVDGVIGSRMTGAGFGGCTVSIVKDEAIDTFIDQVGKAYKEKIGYAADFYVVEIGDGPRHCKKLRSDENRECDAGEIRYCRMEKNGYSGINS